MARKSPEGKKLQQGFKCVCGCGEGYAVYFRNGKYWKNKSHFDKAQEKGK